MADAIHIPLRNQPICQQVQGPTLLPARRRAAGGGDEEGFCLPIQDTRFALGLLALIEGRLQSFFCEAAFDLAYRDVADMDRFTDGGIRQGALLAICVAQQQDLGALSFPLRVLIGAGYDFDFLALLFGERDLVLSGGHEEVPSLKNEERIPNPYARILP